jgi:glycosyltransferase involved in cell wall biosynthesis
MAAVGLRGIPDVEGGIESHAQSLYALLAEEGFQITVHAREGFVTGRGSRRWRGVEIVPSWSPRRAGLEALVHTFIAILKARAQGADVLHIHGVGPALLTPMARLLGFCVVVTHHGRDYEREKWGAFAKFLLRTGERFAARYAHRVICVARNDAERLNRKYGAATAVAIANGAPRLAAPDAPELLKALDLTSRRYILNVARLVPEKRQLDLIAAFGRLNAPGWKLVLVGSALNESDYPGKVEKAARQIKGCVMCGTRGGAELSTLYAHAGAYVLPSAHEGLPVSVYLALPPTSPPIGKSPCPMAAISRLEISTGWLPASAQSSSRCRPTARMCGRRLASAWTCCRRSTSGRRLSGPRPKCCSM